MGKDILKEEFHRLEEFIQKINHIVTPISFRDELKSIMDRERRKALCEKYPKCWIPINVGGSLIPFLPICNRNGMTDPRMIDFSLKLAKRLNNRENIDHEMLEFAIDKLEKLHLKCSQKTPKTDHVTSKKDKISKASNTLNRSLEKNIRKL